jgi:integrase
MAESDEPFDRWHLRYPKADAMRCSCGTRKNPLYMSSDHGRGQRWQARYTDPDGKPRRPAFDSWQDARDHLEEARVAMRKGTWVDPDLGAERVFFYVKQFISRRRANGQREGTTATYEGNLKAHVVPLLGHRISKTLKRRDTMLLVDDLIEKKLAPQTVHNIFHSWSILVHYMIDEDVPLPANIVSRIGLPKVTGRVKVALTPEDVTNLAAAMKQICPRLEILIWIAACAGLRSGEARALTRSSVDWDHDLIYIEMQRHGSTAAELKTTASRATLAVDRFLIEKLRQHTREFGQFGHVTRKRAYERKRTGWIPPADEGLLVTNDLGRPVGTTYFSEKWRAAVRLAGLPQGTRFHDLKHFYTTELGSSGDHDPKTVQALSRHSVFSQTWDTYAHPPRAVDADVTVRAFARAFSSTGG